MNLRRKDTKERNRLAVITTINAGRASNARRGRHKASFSESILDYYYDAGSAIAPSTPLAWTSRTTQVDEWWKYRPLPPTPKPPDQSQEYFIAQNTGASSSHRPVARSTVLLLDRSIFAGPETLDDEGILRRRPHIRRYRRAISEERSSETGTVIEIPASSDHLDQNEALTPLIDSLTKLYADVPHRQRSYTLSSADSEERVDSPSEYSHEGRRHGEEPLLKAFADGRVATLHDWDNGVHYRDAKVYAVPEGKLLPKRASTKEVKGLLQARRKRAGLSIDLRQDSVDDF